MFRGENVHEREIFATQVSSTTLIVEAFEDGPEIISRVK